jgi:general secretion pathway protein F
MTAYQYQVVTQQGKSEKGIIEADSEKHASLLLQKRNLTPLAITLCHAKVKGSSKSSTRLFAKAMGFKDLSLFTRQLSTLLDAGTPLEQALGTMANLSQKKPHIKSIILQLRSRVAEGQTFAASLKAFPKSFNTLYVATIQAGERSSHLSKVLDQLADHIERSHDLHKKIQHALIYPAIMVLVSAMIVAFLVIYVVPKMVLVYGQIHQSLPTLTLVLIAISTGLKRYGLLILVLMLCAVITFYKLMQRRDFKYRVHTLLLRLPVIANAIMVINTARFSKTLSILSASGVSVLEGMTTAMQLVTCLPIQDAIKVAIQKVSEGVYIHRALEQTQFFSPLSTHLIASGENSGQLEAMLTKAAESEEKDITRLIDTVLTLFEPMMILVMGGVVLFIVLAILLPIFNLDQLVH